MNYCVTHVPESHVVHKRVEEGEAGSAAGGGRGRSAAGGGRGMRAG